MASPEPLPGPGRLCEDGLAGLPSRDGAATNSAVQAVLAGH
jgi:hypothetical protein